MEGHMCPDPAQWHDAAVYWWDGGIAGDRMYTVLKLAASEFALFYGEKPQDVGQRPMLRRCLLQSPVT